MIQTTAGKLD